MTKGRKDPKEIKEEESNQTKKILKNLRKNNVHKSFRDAYGAFLIKDKNYEEKELSAKQLYQMENFIKPKKKDDESYMEITELNNLLYHLNELKVYAYCSKISKFNLMKIVWDYVEKIYNKLANYESEKKKRKKF